MRCIFITWVLVSGCVLDQAIPAETNSGEGEVGEGPTAANPAAPSTPTTPKPTGQPPVKDVCIDKLEPPSDGRHRAGTNCMAGGCHGPGSRTVVFTAAGTLYDANGRGVAGATVVIGDFKLVTAANGNFYSALNFGFPTATRVTMCPTTTRMTAPAANGNCNSCHTGAQRLVLK